MAVNEQIVTGRKFRKLIDETNKLWQRISFWTKSSDVEFNDGKNAETKLGAINGITSDLSCEDSTIAASAAALNQVNRSLGGNKLIYENGKYYIQAGADAASKKILGSGATRRITLPVATQIDVKIYTNKWAELDSGNFAVLMKLGTPTANADKAQFTHNHETSMYIYEQVLPSIGWNYNKATGILTISLFDGYLKTQIVSGGYRQATIVTTLPAAINAVYLWITT